MEKIELTKKEREILTLLARCRYATTKQIVALYFQDSQHSRTAFRRANLLLNQIKNRQLITANRWRTSRFRQFRLAHHDKRVESITPSTTL